MHAWPRWPESPLRSSPRATSSSCATCPPPAWLLPLPDVAYGQSAATRGCWPRWWPYPCPCGAALVALLAATLVLSPSHLVLRHPLHHVSARHFVGTFLMLSVLHHCLQVCGREETPPLG